MLLNQKVTLKWNSKIKKHYVDLGYIYTKMGDEFLVDINDLTKGSNARVRVICDYCKNEYICDWHSYYRLKQKDNNKDCCSNIDCIEAKSKESLMIKYGVDCAFKLNSIRQKIYDSNLKKYGCKNPFSSELIKEKIKETNIKKYGVEVPTQNPEIQEKAKKTCLEKYGVSNYGAKYSFEHKGELSPSWKGGVKHHRVERSTYEYRYWRTSVFERDLYTCQCCGIKSGNGKRVELNAHHINNWKDNEDLRYCIDNGITLCNICHMSFHSKYGKSNNNKQQLNEFLCNKKYIDKKLC